MDDSTRHLMSQGVDIDRRVSTLERVAATAVTVPIAGTIDYFGTTQPTGWLFPNGQAVSRTTYSALFAVIGTTHGAGNGTTTFNVPDLRGRVGVGLDDMGGAGDSGRLPAGWNNVLGAAGGVGDALLGLNEIPDHSHSGTTGTENNNHAHGFYWHANAGYLMPPGMGGAYMMLNPNAYGGNESAISGTVSNWHGHNFTTGGVNGRSANTPVSRMQPSMNVNKLIRAV